MVGDLIGASGAQNGAIRVVKWLNFQNNRHVGRLAPTLTPEADGALSIALYRARKQEKSYTEAEE